MPPGSNRPRSRQLYTILTRLYAARVPPSPLQRFLDFARRLCASTSLDSVAVGMVHTTGSAARVLALRAEIVDTDAQELEPFSANGINALRVVRPIAWLSQLIDQIEQKTISEFDPTLDVPAGNWSFLQEHGGHPERGTRAYSLLPQLDTLFDHDALRAMDRAIAKHSGYRMPSLVRLAVRYLGQAGGERVPMQVEFYAPWPISAVEATLEGKRLRLAIQALNAAARERFIINVETDNGGDRLGLDAGQWTQVDGESPGRVTHIGIFEELPGTPRAVNVYYDGLDEVWLHEPLTSREDERLNAEWSRQRLEAATRRARREKSARDHTPDAAGPWPATTITSLHLENFRGLRNVTLKLTPLTVIVGPNQAGKSTVLDALDLLASGARGDLYDAITRLRGGFGQILWRDHVSGVMQLAVDVTANTTHRFRYVVELGRVGINDYTVQAERIYQRVDDRWWLRLDVDRGAVEIGGHRYQSEDSRELFLAQHRALAELPELELIRSILSSIAVYPYFSTGASWTSSQATGMRAPTRPEPGAHISPTGDNLVAALHSLREEWPDTWDTFLAIVKLAFPYCKDIRLPTAVRGYIQLAWYDTRFDQPFDASELSDGTLAYLASLCALLQPGSSLVAIDEPEGHLHPDALYRLIGAARMVSDQRTVLLTTQSDRILAFVDDLPESVVVARASDQGTELVRPDKEDLERWLEEFSLADMRHELETWGEE
jgi:predicted ATPase